jgi:hypothetical protein
MWFTPGFVTGYATSKPVNLKESERMGGGVTGGKITKAKIIPVIKL